MLLHTPRFWLLGPRARRRLAGIARVCVFAPGSDHPHPAADSPLPFTPPSQTTHTHTVSSYPSNKNTKNMPRLGHSSTVALFLVLATAGTSQAQVS